MDSLFITIGLTSFAVAAAMTWFAGTIVRQNRRREAARVTLLSGLAFPDAAPVDSPAAEVDLIASRALATDEFLSESESEIATPIERTIAIDRATTSETLFLEPEKSGAGSRRLVALAAVCGVLTIAVGTYKVFSGDGAPPASAAVTVPVPAPAAPPVTAPEARVELLALDHASTPAGLVVTGRLRNPADGRSLHDVVAVVDVLDRTGRVLTTARASIGRATLNAGESSDFTVATAKTRDVARYRVVFHARERESVPQIDRRPSTPTSQSE